MTIEGEQSVSNITQNKTVEKEDVIAILERADYLTKSYVNGLTTGLRFQGLPSTKGVHVDVVHILDLRKVNFGKAVLGMKAAVLEKTHRSISSILSEFEYIEQYEEKSLRTFSGRINLPMLRSKNLRHSSLIHHTRNVFVVTTDLGSTLDFSWLTRRDHIVDLSQLAMALKSNVVSQKDVSSFIVQEKWDMLGKGYNRGIWSILMLVLSITGFASLIAGLIVNSETLLLAFVASVFGLLGALVFLYTSRNYMNKFQETILTEQNLLSKQCDSRRISESLSELEHEMNMVQNLTFSVSALMASAGDAIESANLEEAIRNACEVLDDCVSNSPDVSSSDGLITDSGLRRFIALFDHLGVNTEDFELQHAYVALTGHGETPLTIEEVIRHLSVLNNSLYNAGIIRPDTKDRIDNMLNNRDAWLLTKKGFQDLPDIPLPNRSDDEETDNEYESVISEIEENEAEIIDSEPESYSREEFKPEDSEPVEENQDTSSEPMTAKEAAMRVKEMREGEASPLAQLELNEDSESGKAET